MSLPGEGRRRIGCDASGVPLAGKVDERRRFHIRFQATEEDIDELGHVNNAVWVTWIQDVSVAHWLTAARPRDADTGSVANIRDRRAAPRLCWDQAALLKC